MLKLKLILLFAIIIYPLTGFSQWTKASTHPSFVFTPFAFNVGQYVYIGSEVEDDGVVDKMTHFEYDIIKNKWRALSKPPFTTRGSFTFSIDGFGYVGSGVKPYGTMFYKDFWRYDIYKKIWVKMADFPGQGRESSNICHQWKRLCLKWCC